MVYDSDKILLHYYPFLSISNNFPLVSLSKLNNREWIQDLQHFTDAHRGDSPESTISDDGVASYMLNLSKYYLTELFIELIIVL